jgi:hypothetical protein
MRNVLIAALVALAGSAHAQVTCEGVNGSIHCSDGSYSETIDGSTFIYMPPAYRPAHVDEGPDPTIGNDKCLVSPSSEGC